VLKSSIAMTALLAVLVSPAMAGAESLVPPGNSAATQYTETFPSSGGNVEVNHGIGGGSSPSKALGSKTAHALESQGEDGRAVAALAAESGGATTAGSGNDSSGSGRKDSQQGGGGAGGDSGGGTGGGSGSGTGGGSAATESSGSSGLGHVLSSATLSSSGESGLLLPLVLIAALVASFVYAWRQRRSPAQKS
jgi:hypothetical protein